MRSQLGIAVAVRDAQECISSTEQLTQDLVGDIGVFSSRLYGSRSRKNLKAIAAMAL